VAIRADGSLWAWGLNHAGRLGIGTDPWSVSNTPVRVGVAYNWTSAVAGDNHTVGIRADGTLWIWGSKGFVANGPIGFSAPYHYGNTPAQVGTDTDWAFASAGGSYTAVIKTDGTLWAWGGGITGFWDGSRTFQNIPEQVGDAADWLSVSVGGDAGGIRRFVAIKADGSPWAWGTNISGQLGDGTETNLTVPVRIGEDYDWVSAQAGLFHTAALRTDGSLWMWGWNQFGQLGDGTTESRSAPVRVELRN